MSGSITWTSAAETGLKEIPFFIRPAACKKIEKFTLEMGVTQITRGLRKRNLIKTEF